MRETLAEENRREREREEEGEKNRVNAIVGVTECSLSLVSGTVTNIDIDDVVKATFCTHVRMYTDTD